MAVHAFYSSETLTPPAVGATTRNGSRNNWDKNNYGLSGSGTDQQLLVFEHFACDVKADLIVWCVSVENADRIKVSYRPSIDRVSGKRVLVPKPYFTLEGDKLLPTQRSGPPAASDC